MREALSGALRPATRAGVVAAHSRGCDPKVLATIRKDIFDIGAPAK
jgi:septum formation topological specificity factor MinE